MTFRRAHLVSARVAVLMLFATGCSRATERTATPPPSSLPVTTRAAAPGTENTDATPARVSATDVTEAVEAPTNRSGFSALNRGVGYGTLRRMTLSEWPGPRDVVIYESLPNELPRVAGVITTVAQTPLSHVNLRAIQDRIPNAYIASATEDPRITELVGRYVKYEVTATGFTVEPATQADVETHHSSQRPSASQAPARNLDARTIRPLAEIGFDDWRAFGVKTANLATLRRLDLPGVNVPDGFGVPFAFYDEFMRANGFYDRVTALLADAKFASDPAEQERQLGELRSQIRDAAMPTALSKALLATQASFPSDQAIRCRSSTNNEDLPNFNGAGLYDSFTQHPEEGDIAKCIKQVYASVWNLRAFLERDFYRIDHLSTAIGVLLIPSFSDERVNGVAVGADPVYETPDAFYVNSQVGEDLVTNPSGTSIPEALLLGAGGTVAPISRSSLAKPGTLLMSPDQLRLLRTSMENINAEFTKLYKPAAGSKFAMEIEFKITKTNELAIKQARTWVFR